MSDGRLFEIRDKGKVQADAAMCAGGIEAVEIRHSAPAETIEA